MLLGSVEIGLCCLSPRSVWLFQGSSGLPGVGRPRACQGRGSPDFAFCPGCKAGAPSQTSAHGPQPGPYLMLNFLTWKSVDMQRFNYVLIMQRGAASHLTWTDAGRSRDWPCPRVPSWPAGHGQPSVARHSTVSPTERASVWGRCVFGSSLARSPWLEAAGPPVALSGVCPRVCSVRFPAPAQPHSPVLHQSPLPVLRTQRDQSPTGLLGDQLGDYS